MAKILMTAMSLGIGGAETHVLEIATVLSRLGESVTVASAGGVFADLLKTRGIRHIQAPLDSRNLGSMIRSYRILDRLLREETFDVVHAHARIPALISARLAKKHGIRFVTTAHYPFRVTGLLRRLSQWGERTIAVSEDIRAYLVREYGLCPDNITVTVNGIDTGFYTPPAPGKKEPFPRIVSVSRLDADRSAPAHALCALAPRLASLFPGVRIELAGDGDDLPALRAEADAANRAAGRETVRLTGPLSDVRELLSGASVFVNVSRAALEAMAMAVPVILAGNEGYLGIFRPSGLSRALESNFCCRGCEPLTPDRLLSDLVAVLSLSPEERKQMGEANRSVVETQFSLSRMAEDYRAVYRAVRPYRRPESGDLFLCGYYGQRNLGDEAMLRAILCGIRSRDPDRSVTVLSARPKETARQNGVSSVSRLNPFRIRAALSRASLFVLGGGNLLQDGTSARSLLYYRTLFRWAKSAGLPCVLYANGIGPLSVRGAERVRPLLREADRISLREEASLSFCEEAGVPAEKRILTADPVFLLTPAPEEQWMRLFPGKTPEFLSGCFLIALRPGTGEAPDPEAIPALCAFLKRESGLSPVFLAMHRKADSPLLRTLQAQCPGSIVLSGEPTGSELIGMLSRMAFCLTGRLHALVASVAAGTPCLSLSDEEKLTALAARVSLPSLFPAAGADALISAVTDLLSRSETIRSELVLESERLRKLAEEDADEIVRILNDETEKGETR
ncbi:MAG: polysaccharide pyruvyl transferase CsaB [Clostridia bacterium]|nr:polysaccharide pyruvyl transferase CsaB [Clostridia bacterium]